jgi:hypothetical protein
MLMMRKEREREGKKGGVYDRAVRAVGEGEERAAVGVNELSK